MDKLTDVLNSSLESMEEGVLEILNDDEEEVVGVGVGVEVDAGMLVGVGEGVGDE